MFLCRKPVFHKENVSRAVSSGQSVLRMPGMIGKGYMATQYALVQLCSRQLPLLPRGCVQGRELQNRRELIRMKELESMGAMWPPAIPANTPKKTRGRVQVCGSIV